MISSFSAKQVATREYVSCVEREEEMIRLRTQVTARKSILVFGPEGVGKSRLLRGFVEGRPQALYVAQTHSPHAFLVSLLIAMRSVVNPEVTPDNPTTLSTVSLKGIVRRFLENHSFLLVLDQLNGPSSCHGPNQGPTSLRTHASGLRFQVTAHGGHRRAATPLCRQIGAH